MGRPRKPLTEQRGNLTVITMQTREAEEDSVTTDKNQLKRPPTWLIDNVAKKEWRRIVKELEKINSYDWNADEATINRWYDEDGYETQDSKLTKLTDNVSMIEPESGYYDTESLARFAFARFYRAVQFAQENRVPVLMDF